jgi:hypothetical protein
MLTYLPYGIISILTLNALYLHSVVVGVLMTGAYFLYFSLELGKKTFPSQATFQQCVVGMLGTLSITTLPLAILLLTYKLTLQVSLVSFLATSILLLLYIKPKKIPLRKVTITPEAVYLHTSYYLLLITSFTLIYTSRTYEAVASLWEIFSPLTTITVIATGALLFFMNYRLRTPWHLANISLFFLLITYLGTLAYALGYGYDGFIHQATEKLLIQTGAITPPPVFYSGYYALISLLHHLTHIPYTFIDRLLPGLLFAFTVPTLTYTVISKLWKTSSSKAYLSITTLLVLPLTLFINPTPQALSLTMTLAVIIMCCIYAHDTSIKLGIITLIALAAFFVHPMSGIAALLAVVFVILRKHRWVSIFVALGASFLYPVMLLLANGVSQSDTGLRLSLPSLEAFIRFPFTRQYHFLLDTLYTIGNTLYIVLPVLALSTAIFLLYTRHYKPLHPHAYLISALCGNYILLLTVLNFDFLAKNESLFFAHRLLDIIIWLSLPFFFYHIFSITLKNTYQKIGIIILIVAALVSSVYLAYPRNDDYHNTGFINLSIHDIYTVHFIDTLADDYIVLAPQMTSAAALKEFGFERTVTTNTDASIFFYPIPTGEQLHDYYLQLLYEENTTELIALVKDYTNQSRVYVVLPSYWSNYPAIDQKLRQRALTTFDQNAQNTIYVF